MADKIKITYDDLKSPKVDETLARQAEEAALRTGAGTASEEMKKVSLIYKSWFNLMIAGLIGSLGAWALVEPSFKDTVQSGETNTALLMLLSVGGLTGLMIGSMEGILARNFQRSLKAGIMRTLNWLFRWIGLYGRGGYNCSHYHSNRRFSHRSRGGN